MSEDRKLGGFPQEQHGMKASRMGLDVDTGKCGAGLGEGPVWKQVRGGKRDPQQHGKLTQEDFTSCGCGWIPRGAKGKGQNQD